MAHLHKLRKYHRMPVYTDDKGLKHFYETVSSRKIIIRRYKNIKTYFLIRIIIIQIVFKKTMTVIYTTTFYPYNFFLIVIIILLYSMKFNENFENFSQKNKFRSYHGFN